MDAIRDDLCVRARELRSYLRHVGTVSDAAKSEAEKTIARSLRAAAYLIIYNLVEATARNAVIAVFDRLKDESISFNRLTVNLKLFLLKDAKKHSPETLAGTLTDIATDIVVKVFKSDALFAGNVDAKSLRRMASRIGYRTNFRTEREAPALVAVKNRRNDLAHGNKSFGEIGRETTVEDLRIHARHAIRYMCELIRNVELFIKSQSYLAAS
jgi:hypothetical protein